MAKTLSADTIQSVTVNTTTVAATGNVGGDTVSAVNGVTGNTVAATASVSGPLVLTDVVTINSALDVFSGAVDPSAGAGVAAAVGSIYFEETTSRIWQKVDSADTDWVVMINRVEAMSMISVGI